MWRKISNFERTRPWQSTDQLSNVFFIESIELPSRVQPVASVPGATHAPLHATGLKLSIPCPECGSTLTIVKSRTTGKRFIGCSGRMNRTTDCTFGLPLPQSGTIILLEKKCPKCGFQMIQLKLPDRQEFASCPYCYSQSLKHKT